MVTHRYVYIPPRSKSFNYLNVTLVATGPFQEHINVEVFVDDVDDQSTLSKAQEFHPIAKYKHFQVERESFSIFYVFYYFVGSCLIIGGTICETQ